MENYSYIKNLVIGIKSCPIQNDGNIFWKLPTIYIADIYTIKNLWGLEFLHQNNIRNYKNGIYNN